MKEQDTGIVPVTENERNRQLTEVVTDRRTHNQGQLLNFRSLRLAIKR
jgi:hypothetical protein